MNTILNLKEPVEIKTIYVKPKKIVRFDIKPKQEESKNENNNLIKNKKGRLNG